MRRVVVSGVEWTVSAVVDGNRVKMRFDHNQPRSLATPPQVVQAGLELLRESRKLRRITG